MKKSKIEDKLTWGKLAAALGIARQTLGTWRKRPGAPTTPNLEAWQVFVEQQQLGIRHSPEHKKLQGEKLRREIALLDIKVARERRQVIPVDEVDGLLSRIASGQRAELIQFAEVEAVTLAEITGGDVGAMRDLLRGLVDRQCDLMETGIGRWLGRKTEPPAEATP